MIPPATLTLNPAIDQTVFLDRLLPGEVNRVSGHHIQAGGKGVNVSAMLAAYGISSTAAGFLGKKNEEQFTKLFRDRGIDDAFIRLPGETRTGIKIVDGADGRTTDINFPGLAPGAADLALLEERLSAMAMTGRWFVIGGSLPAGMDAARLPRLIRLLKDRGALVAVDASGPALRAAVGEGVDLIKPNEHELAEYLGSPPGSFADAVNAAVTLHRGGIGHVVLSLGGRGAVFAAADGVATAGAPPVEVAGTVGAGDAMLAGYLAGVLEGRGLQARARLATVFAWCVLEDTMRRLPDHDTIRRRMDDIMIRADGAAGL